jgi:hypothetical protein
VRYRRGLGLSRQGRDPKMSHETQADGGIVDFVHLEANQAAWV